MELVEEVEMALALSQISDSSFSVLIQESETHSAASSAQGEDPMLQLFGSEKLDVLSIEAGEIEDSPTYSPAFGGCDQSSGQMK